MRIADLIKLTKKNDSLEHVDPTLEVTDGIPIQHVDDTPPPTLDVDIEIERKPDAFDKIVDDFLKIPTGENNG